MIKMLTQEYREGNLAVRTIVITFFGIPVFRFRKTSTNNIAVRQLSELKETFKVNGYYENEN